MKLGFLLPFMMSVYSIESRADDCIVSFHGAHYVSKTAQSNVSSSKMNQLVRAATAAGAKGTKIYEDIRPTCVRNDGIEYMFRSTAVLTDDFQKLETYDCFGTAVLSNDAARFIRTIHAPKCFFKSKDIPQD